MNDREYLARLEAASTAELSEMLRRPTVEEERLLARYFGEERLARLRRLALGTAKRGPKRGNVIVLHGIMGGELTVNPPKGSPQHVWMNFPRLIFGAIGWLRVSPQFQSESDVRATGILKKWYGELLLGLGAGGWNVREFFYDWRLDLAELADALRKKMDASFGATAPVHLVAHSMGGLVSRTFILRHPDRWKRGGRLVMLGTPNHGSFAIPQVITGAESTVRKLATVDIKHNLAEVLTVLNSMPGAMQMLPSPLVMPSMAPMYDVATWARYGVTPAILKLARQSHDRLAKIVDGERMSYIAGCNQPTKVDVTDWNRLDDASGYADGLDGDGTVPHRLSFLQQDGQRIPTYFIEENHGALPNNATVIAHTQSLLEQGTCALPMQPPKVRAMASVAAASTEKQAAETREEAEVSALARRVQAQSATRGGEEAPKTVTSEELRAEALIVRSFLAESGAASGTAPAASPTGRPRPAALGKTASIEVRIVHGGIEQSAELAPGADAISVGHYVGVAPQNAELALDWAVSQKIAERSGTELTKRDQLLITSLFRRGVIVGELGQNFTLPDPRDPQRVIAVAGMGQPGRFRESELTVLTRELAWMLGRSGKKHLCTVLIGAGAGNLDVNNAVRGWLRGLRRALYDASAAGEPSLKTVTFVDCYAANFLRLDRALVEAVATFAHDPEPLRITYRSPDAPALRKITAKAEAIAKNNAVKVLRKQLDRSAPSADVEPIRLTVRLVGNTFEFAALTSEASMPQRDTRIDPTLIDEANDLLPASADFAAQADKGHLLGRLLLPGDLRDAVMKPPTPIVVSLDRSTARIHWEMLALRTAAGGAEFDGGNHLGTACGLTRQLRSTFAPLPEPPLLSGRTLRVLVVADPAEDAPLPGAQEEGEAVVQIFERFREVSGVEVEVVALLGPRVATRVAVLEHLINHRFDLLHFAGHCFFNEKDSSASGWVFTGGHVLSANELNRVDRIPRFVFSNACESGVTPERRSALLAPSFAESFFARGVANFICTAWPVDDAAALAFAQRLYTGILGLSGNAEPMHEAMSAARREIAAASPGGLQTWGAYQHYGDPNFRVLREQPTSPPQPKSAVKESAPRKAPAKTAVRRKPKKR